ncbi:unnamed protein product [Paramecium primaurelia]|uniref:Rab-GAP TBC domain-containing protein n=1 Tax=Paramecium primaurelia TaxID=5886 RepID=A0A8S1LYX0_PARPR|nr:unnamed protein product [Paramecium primaurelia]
MGPICTKDKTNKIVIRGNAKPVNTPTPDVPPKTINTHKYVGEEFQQEIEKNDPAYSLKQSKWNQYYQKKYELINDDTYIALIRRSTSIEQLQQQTNEDDQCKEPKINSNKHFYKKILMSLAQQLDGPFKLTNQDIMDAYLLKEINNEDFKNILMDGAISKYRWNFWMAQVYRNKDYDPLLYSKLKNQTPAQKVLEDITKDVNRTFPSHDHFKEYNQGQQQLFSILKALSILNEDIGYVQGMNYIVGFSLIVSGGKEEEVFWLIHFINTNPLFLWWEIYRVNFNYTKALCQVFLKNFNEQLPALYQHFQDEGISDQQYIWQWILTQFLYTFPIDSVIFFWDFILATDIFSIIKLSIAFLNEFGYDLIQKDIGQISEFFTGFIKDQLQIDVPKIIKDAKQIDVTMTDDQKQFFKNYKPQSST